ncbi:methyl-CpG-binding domain-containing protein 7-like [Vicia villosa]|uniref:methyl-CpG-binding domain-containing protein 7-like n=1 Tax=Vicia villosa TaxID=3911 RepID=UPI00273B78AC|nr:methyl-CpG-binding domain-containing protein 7-like [Vicia villosa]
MSLTIAPKTAIDDENQLLNHNPTTSRGKQLKMTTPSRFNLPDDWLVQQRPRTSNPDHIDKYYIEPGSGQKFRSLISVRRYLNGETRDYLPTERMISENKNTLFLDNKPNSGKLPDDWVVNQVRRTSNPNHVDRYYIEPHTGQKFRSLISVRRYLNEETRDYLPTERMISENKNSTGIKSRPKQKFRSARDYERHSIRENACRATPKVPKPTDYEGHSFRENACRATPKVPKPSDYEGHSIRENACRATPKDFERTHYWKKIKTGKDDITRPPTKVRWVLSGPGGFWNPFLNGSTVPASESEKTKWSEIFSISINEEVTNGY